MIRKISTDRKSIIYISTLLLISAPVIIYSWYDTFIFIWIFFFHLSVVGALNKKRAHIIVLTTVLYLISYVPVLLTQYVLDYLKDIRQFIVFIGLMLFLAIQSIYPILKKYFQKWFKAAANEKINYNVIQNYPDVMCSKHNSRTSLEFNYGYHNLNCRHNDKCFAGRKMIAVKHIIGVIGNDNISGYKNGNYYVKIIDSKESDFINADFDIIEIHENPEIKNYDSLLNKIISFLYNEINRYKPISEVEMKIVGDPCISENTKRLLEEKFLNLEYYY